MLRRKRLASRPAWCSVIPLQNMAAIITSDIFEVVADRLDIGEDVVRTAEELLSDEERDRAGRFVFARDRNRFIVARAGLRKLLAERLKISPEMVELEYGPHGKPALASGSLHEDLRFNISHADDVVVYAISKGCEIGVDVEAVHAIPDIDEVAAHCFSTHESAAYRRLDRSDKLQGFFNCWTRKEAFVKAIGEGLSHPLDSFDVTLAPTDDARLLRVGSGSEDHSGWQLFSFDPFPDYVGAVVVDSPTQQVNLIPATRMYRSQLNDNAY